MSVNFTKTLAGWGHAAFFEIVKTYVLALAHYLQILNFVVQRVMVDVVDKFGTLQHSIQMLRHYETMFVNVAFLVGHRVLRFVEQNVTVIVDKAAAFPFVIFVAGLLNAFRMTGETRGGMPTKISASGDRVLNDRSRLTATAFAQTGRNLIGFRNVSLKLLSGRFNARVVTGNKPRLVVFPSLSGIRDLCSAAAFTGSHTSVIITQ